LARVRRRRRARPDLVLRVEHGRLQLLLLAAALRLRPRAAAAARPRPGEREDEGAGLRHPHADRALLALRRRGLQPGSRQRQHAEGLLALPGGGDRDLVRLDGAAVRGRLPRQAGVPAQVRGGPRRAPVRPVRGRRRRDARLGVRRLRDLPQPVDVAVLRRPLADLAGGALRRVDRSRGRAVRGQRRDEPAAVRRRGAGDGADAVSVTASDVARRADEAGLRLVRFLWCGNDGTVRAKASARHGLEGRLASGIGLTVAMQAMNGLDQLQPIEGMGPVGEVRLVPDLETFRVLPYTPHAGALLTDHIGLDGEPAPVCQRSFLKRMEARLGERGLTLRASFENEFSLARRVDGEYVPIDSALCFSTIAMTAAQDYVDELAAALEAQGIVLEQYYAELGHGQQEISTGHAPALQAADEQLLVRETLRGVAARQGLVASLAPKPWPENAGNG